MLEIPSLTLVSAPAGEPLSVAEVKPYLRGPESADDVLIGQLIRAAHTHVDGWQNRALLTQTWDLKLDEFPDGCDRRSRSWYRAVGIQLPMAPIQGVTFVKYVDTAGAEQTLDPSKYVVLTAERSRLVIPAPDQSWPSTRDHPEAVTIRFVAGYGNASKVPEGLKIALAAFVAHFYENREPVGIGVGAVAVKIPMHVEALLEPYRVWGGF